jgi:RNA polymerase sigma factor (TIGR02999 family)
MINSHALPTGVTQLLVNWSSGDKAALDEMVPLVYQELRRIAVNRLRQERPNHTLQPTALVNEAYLRLIDQKNVSWQNRAQFFGLAAEMMRRILVNHALHRRAAKRGGGALRVSLEVAVNSFEQKDVNLVALDDALKSLFSIDPRKSQIVELKFFGGLTVEEIAEVLHVSSDTIEREWKMARAWLHLEIRNGNQA